MKIDVNDIIKKLKEGDLSSLSKAITIIESKATKHKTLGSEILRLSKVENSEKSIRVGISGMPGAGKSTFINSLGMYLISKGYKVAVLAVDPSSTVSKGSILGDKTRMEELSKEEKAFIRPTSSGGYLGGTAGKTRDVISLCEAAGYDIILVETVGIGQSETEVKTMVDIFLLLILPAGGDDLQGIKKGAVELADLVIINKADGDKEKIARRTKVDYEQAIRILGGNNKFDEKVILCSALNNIGTDIIWENINKYYINNEDEIQSNRFIQDKYWIDKRLNESIIERIFSKPEIKSTIEDYKTKILKNELSMEKALNEIFNLI